MSDRSLVLEIQMGNNSAFGQLFSLYSQKIFRTAYFILKDKQFAEDVVQEVFLQVYLKVHKLKVVEAFDVWLYRITVNQCSNFFKKIDKNYSLDSEEELPKLEADSTNNFDSPESTAIKREESAVILNCIEMLQPKHRIVLTLFYYSDMSIPQISNILNCSEGTVKSRLFHARNQLRRELLNNGFNIDDNGNEKEELIRAIR